MPRILIVDDEPAIRNILSDILINSGYKVDEAVNGNECLKKIKTGKYDLILLDIKMQGMDGHQTFAELSEKYSDIPVIMMSGHGSLETAVDLVKRGAFDYIQKPPDLSRLLITIRNALEKSTLTSEVKVHRQRNKKAAPEMIGTSANMLLLKEQLKKVAASNSRVLITGPNGAGKELVALNLHYQSARKKNPFIEVNCAAIPSELIESELFGHEKGAFTGASSASVGKFEQANGGTIFLDEIGDMSESAQAKVLRALQENKITKVGGKKDIYVDVRVIAATNKDLEEMISLNRFREDLYYRLAVVPIDVPPLNNRREDIPMLAEYFVDSICKSENKPIRKILPDAMKLLQEFNYHGNIRELRNIIERLLILGSPEISVQDVNKHVISKSSSSKMMLKRLVGRLGGPQKAIDFINREFEGVFD
jgi:DNA-binding NtrC family response regulator